MTTLGTNVAVTHVAYSACVRGHTRKIGDVQLNQIEDVFGDSVSWGEFLDQDRSSNAEG